MKTKSYNFTLNMIKVKENTTAIDVAFNLSGSLAGFPAVLGQVPAGERIGFATLPKPWEDKEETGQTWTPDLQNKELVFDVETYNEKAMRKAPFSTPVFLLETVTNYGNTWLETLSGIPVTEIPIGFNMRGKRIVFTRTHLPLVHDSIERGLYLLAGGFQIRRYSTTTPANTYVRYVINEEERVLIYLPKEGFRQTEIQVPDDQDYPVRMNNLILSDSFGDGWLFKYAYVI